jgi:hypothetical protein
LSSSGSEGEGEGEAEAEADSEKESGEEEICVGEDRDGVVMVASMGFVGWAIWIKPVVVWRRKERRARVVVARRYMIPGVEVPRWES